MFDHIKSIHELGLSAEDLERRKHSLGGSDANIIMSGDEEKVHRLWLEKTGQKESEDLTGVLPVQMGNATEWFNLLWYEYQTGRTVKAKQTFIRHPEYDFIHATLDGKTVTSYDNIAILEAKHVNQFSKIDAVVEKYLPQTHMNMSCAGLQDSVLSVLIGTLNYEIYEGQYDAWYGATLIDRMREFWDCVQNKRPPNNFGEAVAAPVTITEFRKVDMTSNNSWASFAADYLENEGASKKFEKAKKELKDMVEDDVEYASGHGIAINRTKSNSLTFKKLKG